MKGIILAGGLGTRLHPLTKVTNKCLLPVYNKPMIYYPIQLMVDAGITEILLICGGNSLGDFLPLLGNGEEFGLKGLTYRVQSEPRGIADALGLAEDWANNDNICVLLSDNIFEDNIKESVEKFTSGAQVFLSKVAHPEHYGVAEISENDQVVSIVEKPKNPKSDWAVTGLYIYDQEVWDFIKTLEPSARGELEITDVNNYYLREGKLQACKLNGWWADCGENFDGYLDACNKVKDWQKNDGFPKDEKFNTSRYRFECLQLFIIIINMFKMNVLKINV
jgi:glucose-1-phosphate thymidylyltransferase